MSDQREIVKIVVSRSEKGGLSFTTELKLFSEDEESLRIALSYVRGAINGLLKSEGQF
jgi:hypothetical protein